jgi:hypothetical protein
MRAVMNVSEEPDPHGRAILWLQIADIKFYQADKIVPLRLVPAVIYSEVMRDIGLFVSASKATKDSGWRDTIPSKEMSE